MKTLSAFSAFLFLGICSQTFADAGPVNAGMSGELHPPPYELAVESGYLFGVFNAPQDYQIAAEFITGRVRWGVMEHDGWLRGYNQFYFSAVAEPILEGIENHYFGLNFGLRYNFVQPGSRLIPYFSGGVGLGWIDSHADIPGGQGQDFTFNVLAATGLSYKVSDQWNVNVGILYQHLSNAGQTDPNPSLNLLGPQVGVSYSF
jgi:lipid A 3-O-deacylase